MPLTIPRSRALGRNGYEVQFPTRLMQHGDRAKSKYAASVNAWLDKLYALPDPEWTAELAAKHAADQEAA
ncbi:hypothetical protein GAS19_11665 [Burkholderia glumae]|uniref:hypothetical protein n=1 Tax=Burkholderia glumae TaxID=337 RepID=UPI001295D136|nr:hypothetical protein [Burkholderia glumae]QGA38207.1 hypothetical protein GAS19_11665 [Burkholderia glumae]